MGFSVTASLSIFFIAALSAGSVAMNVWWDSAENSTAARERWQGLAQNQLRTNLTLTVDSCNSNCQPAPNVRVRLDVHNTGTTVVDFRNLTYIIDGTLHTITNVTAYNIISPASVSNTDLIIPGETMQVEFEFVVLTADYANDGSDLPVQVITLDGVIGRR